MKYEFFQDKMIRYSKQITVNTNHVDTLNHVNNVVYLQWVNDIAEEHWELIKPKNENSNLAWVVRQHELVYFAPAFLGQELTVITTLISWRGPISVRQVFIKNSEEKEIFKATTQWCYFDLETNRPAKLGQEIIALFQQGIP